LKYSKPISVTTERLAEGLPDDDLHLESKAIAAHLRRLPQFIKSLEEMAEHKDPTKTDAAHHKAVHDSALKLEKKFDEISNSVHSLSVDAASKISQAIDEKAGLRPDDFAAEVRASVRAMKPDKRREVLKAAIDEGDSATVASLCDAPAVCTGLSKEFTSTMRRAFVERHAPKELAAQSRLTDLVSHSSRVVQTAKAALKNMSDPKEIAEIQHRAEESAKAKERLDAELNE